MVATGHYCRKDTLSDGTHRILAGSDPNKDQSYFLCQLSQEQLAKAMFPIGDILKPEVRRLAHEADLPSADKKDSQGICFVGKVDLPTFLQQKLKPCEGDIVEVYDAYYAECQQYMEQQSIISQIFADGNISLDGITDEQLQKISEPVVYDITFKTETYRSGKKHIKKTRYKAHPHGKIIGKHDGAQFYTIGQRKGLNVGGHEEPVFVIETDVERNIIYVGEGHGHKGLSRRCLRIASEDIHWIRPDQKMEVGQTRRYSVRIRYRQPLQEATLIMRETGLYILFDEPQRGITRGQFAAWYTPVEESLATGAHDTSMEMIGSGVI